MPESSKEIEASQEPNQKKPNRTLVVLQATTGIIISAFTIAHLSNHFVMHFGLEAHKMVFAQLRKVYTQPIVESILLGSIGVHSGIALVRYQGIANTFSKILFQTAGWFLLLAMPGHVFATRYYGQHVGMAEYDITHAAMAARLLPLVFVPYNLALAMSGAIHALGGLGRAGQALGIQPLKSIPSRGAVYIKWSTILGGIAASSALAVMGVYFKYPMDEQLLIQAHLEHLPAFVRGMIELPNSERWFGNLKWPNGK